MIVGPSDIADVLADPVAKQFVRRFVGARELIQGLDRWCIWMPVLNSSAVEASKILSERIDAVRAYRDDPAKDRSVYADRSAPYRFHRVKPRDSTYLCIPRVVSENRKYFTSARLPSEVIASDAVFTTPDVDGFLFGLISSSAFMVWQKTIGGRLESRLRFSNTIVWNNFPLNAATGPERSAVIEAGRKIVAARENYPGLSLADLYDPRKMPLNLQEAHDALDAVVDPLFGLTGEPSEERRQQCLFDRYAELTGQ